MSTREALIARKNELRSQIQRLQRQYTVEQEKGEDSNRRQLRKLEDQLERLRAQEYQLRQQIDRSPH